MRQIPGRAGVALGTPPPPPRRPAHGRCRLVAGLVVVTACVAAPAARAAASEPHRVASLTLAADEVLVEILPPERLVAATYAAEDPASSNIVGRLPAELPRFFRAEMERLVALRPDLVVVSEYTDADFLALLEASGLRYHRMAGLASFAGIRAAIQALGDAVGRSRQAAAVVAEFDARVAEVARRLAGAPRPRVLYWFNPYTAGADTAIGSLIECAGGVNVGAELGVSGLVPIGAERAFVADPDVVLVGRVPGQPPDDLVSHPLLSRLRAVGSGHVVDLPARQIVAVSQRAADACAALARRLHPDRFPAERP